MPRLFTGLAIPVDIALELSFLQGGIRNAKWIDQENYHITLRFIGDIDNNQAEELAENLNSDLGPCLNLELEAVGYFASGQPKAVWAGVKLSERLMALQAKQERLCQLADLAPERRKFTPHVTLARLRGRTSMLEVENFVAQHANFRSRPFHVADVVLFSAKPSTGGGPYLIEQSYPLT